MDLEPSENNGPLRNDGRSVHHRAELEKELACIERKIADLKRDIGGLEASPGKSSILLDTDGWKPSLLFGEDAELPVEQVGGS